MGQNRIINLISLGDELLLGIRENSHLTYIGKKLADRGLNINSNFVIPDKPEVIKECFEYSWKSADIVITTGGLGPTQDDLTLDTIAKSLGLKLVIDVDAEVNIRNIFQKKNIVVTNNVLRQSYKPEGSEILPNEYGTAPGIWYEKDSKILIMLPGPESELKSMFEKFVLPKIEKLNLVDFEKTYVQIRTCGVGESTLEEKLNPILSEYEDKLNIGYCAHHGMVDVRLKSIRDSLTRKDVERIGDRCSDIVDEDFICFGDETIENIIVQHLIYADKKFAVAESCTGGLLSNVITDVPGASNVFNGGIVCYTDDSKVLMLDVPEALIQQHGSVSAECAVAMATGVAEKYSVDYGLSVTGYAGPGVGDSDNPVGTVYVGYSSALGAWSQKFNFTGTRTAIKKRAVIAALDWARRKFLTYDIEEFDYLFADLSRLS